LAIVELPLKPELAPGFSRKGYEEVMRPGGIPSLEGAMANY
jgi:hypothetical protein